MSQYFEIKEMIDGMQCPECHGIGKCDDAELGDISFNQWVCKTCQGSGFQVNIQQRLKTLVYKIKLAGEQYGNQF